MAFGQVGVVLSGPCPWRGGGRHCWRLYALPIASLPLPSPNSLAEVGVAIEAAGLLPDARTSMNLIISSTDISLIGVFEKVLLDFIVCQPDA